MDVEFQFGLVSLMLRSFGSNPSHRRSQCAPYAVGVFIGWKGVVGLRKCFIRSDAICTSNKSAAQVPKETHLGAATAAATGVEERIDALE